MTSPSRAFAPLDLIQLISIALIWGVNNILAKIAVDSLPAMMTVALRFIFVLAVLIWLIKPPPRGQWRLFALMLAFIGPLHFGIQYVGLKLATDIAPMVVAMQLWAPASVMFAALLLKERVSLLRWAGVIVAFLGVAAMTFDPAVLAQGLALALVALASLCYGLGAVLVRRLSATDVWSTQAWIALAIVPAMVIVSSLFETGHVEAAIHAHWFVWFALIFGGLISSIVANAFLFQLVTKYEVSRTTPYLLLTPVISFTLAAIVLHNQITPQILIGAALTISGVLLVAIAERRFKAVA
ncbi:MAG: DMT family transporter [Hyphomonadaceae bacterium]